MKNKDPIEMYFLERLKPDYSADATGEVPNAAFVRKRAELAEAATSALPNALGCHNRRATAAHPPRQPP